MQRLGQRGRSFRQRGQVAGGHLPRAQGGPHLLHQFGQGAPGGGFDVAGLGQQPGGCVEAGLDFR
jgi:hypothetical protein